MSLTKDQVVYLAKPIDASRVQQTAGHSNLESWDVIAHLTRVFGFDGWSKEIEYGLIFEHSYAGPSSSPGVGAPSRWDVAYHAKCRLSAAGVVHEDAATGTAKNQPSRADAHDLALKAAVSGALKRAAKDLGNQFGLSLYNNGSIESVTPWSLAYPHE